MRLLNVRTLEFRYFFDERPAYLILSHRWTEGETSLQAFEHEKHLAAAQQSAGTRKVLRFCTLTQTHTPPSHAGPLDWCWVDTCCIDKTSSAELTEAINSMYRWYREAAECFVYINDLSHSALAAARAATDDGTAWHKALRDELNTSHWFTRGWTLQELLAPTRQVFLDDRWEPVGSREDLADVITEISGIDSACFGDEAQIRKRTVAERMSWAAGRRTSRAEDSAYCLLGIFGVHIPLIYGEGGRHAFRRLQEEIIRTDADETVFAWVATGEGARTQGGLLAESPADFAYIADKKVVLTRREYLDRDPYSITNRGLRWESYDVPGFDSFENIEIVLNCVNAKREFFVVMLTGERFANSYRRRNCHQECFASENLLPWPNPDSQSHQRVKLYLQP